MDNPKYDLPRERQTTYYIGMVIAGVGVLVFLSTFFSGPSVHDSFGQFERGMQNTAATAICGMVLTGVGVVVANVGRSGLAGSGLKLDPRQAREDLEPWNRSAGGMLNDALEEVKVLQPNPSAPEVKVRCPKCRALNDETDKFCGQCGAPL